MNAQNVHDESYRKAGKLDRESFSTTFDVARSGLLDLIGAELLERKNAGIPESVSAEVYALNVYGKWKGARA